jgi:hypothetical protein
MYETAKLSDPTVKEKPLFHKWMLPLLIQWGQKVLKVLPERKVIFYW